MIKRTVMVILAVMLTAQMATATTLKKLIKEFKTVEEADYIYLNKMYLNKTGLKTNGYMFDGLTFPEGIKSIAMLVLDDCTPDVRNRFVNKVQKLSGYEELTTINDDDEDGPANVQLLTKTKGKYIRELAILIVSEDECITIAMKGKFNTDKLQQVMNSLPTKQNKD